MALVAALSVAVPARADISPANCKDNRADPGIGRDVLLARPGDTVNFTMNLRNTGVAGDSPCDVTVTTPLVFTLPDHTGSPAGVATTILPANSDIKAGAVYPRQSFPWVVAIDPGKDRATAHVHADAVLHSLPNGFDTANIDRTISVQITQPHMTLTKVANPTSGVVPPPFTTTYTYTLTNDSSTPVPIAPPNGDRSQFVTDDKCSPVTYASGDSNNNTLLDNGEVWTFSCRQTFTQPGVYVNTALAAGTSTVDNRPVNAGPVQAQVVVTTPQAAAVPPAKPVAVAAPVVKPTVADTCIESPKSLSLRARELTTVRVTLNSKTKGVKVTVKGPGFTKTLKTNAKGQATFRVRPTRSGTLTITSTNCAKVTKAAVKAARKTVAQALPQVTG